MIIDTRTSLYPELEMESGAPQVVPIIMVM